MTVEEAEGGVDLDAALDVDELNLLFSSADENAEVGPEEMKRRVREAFIAHPDTRGPKDDAEDPAWGAITWFADRTGMHFSSASKKMRGDLPIKVRDVLYLQALEREAGTDE